MALTNAPITTNMDVMGGDAAGGGSVACPKVRVVGNGGISGVEAMRGCIQEMQTLGADSRHHLGRESAPGKRFTDAQEPAGAGN